MARPSKEIVYTPKTLERIKEWAAKGLTNQQIAKNLKIGLSTFYHHKSINKDLSDAIKTGKEPVDDQVENALFKRAIGHTITEKKYEIVDMPSDEFAEYSQPLLDEWKEAHPNWTVAQRDKFLESLPREKRILVEEKVKEVPPDTIAALFWLKNRRPSEWRDKRNIEMSGGVENRSAVDLSGITTEDLKKYAETLEKAIEEGEGNDGA